MKRKPRTSPNKLLLVGVSCGILAACGKENAYVPPPLTEVDVQPPLVKDLTVYEEYTGRTEPFKRYEVRSRVTGFIEEKHFEDGKFVEEGKLLFGIERVQFEAAVTKAQGDLAKAQADLKLAETNYDRKSTASESGAVSKIDVAAALAEKDVAAANVTIAEAALTDAKQNLDYCDIKSAISGRVSRALVDPGNLVSGTQSTLLATVVQDDPIYVTIEISQREILNHLHQRPNSNQPEISGEAKEMKLKLEKADGSDYGMTGKFHSIDNEINIDSGTIEVTSEFPNPDGHLAAGLSVRLQVPTNIESAVIIPAAAIQRDLLGTYVFVKGEDGAAKRQTVVVSRFSKGELAIIDEGLGAEDRVIVSNLQRVRPGVKVNPTEIAPPTIGGESDPPAGDEPPQPEPASAARLDTAEASRLGSRA